MNKCPNCEGKVVATMVPLAGEYAGKEYTLETEVDKCEACGLQELTMEQYGAFSTALADEYRQEQGLLTSEEIRHRRAAMKMTQEEFADYLGVGLASLKRWEGGRAQDESKDQLIRLKTDEELAEQNLQTIVVRLGGPKDEYSGERAFSLKRLGQMILFFLWKGKEEETREVDPLRVNKLCWYADTQHFKNFGEGLTGTRYASLPYGPVINNYRLIFRSLRDVGVLETAKSTRLEPEQPFNEGQFTADELATLEAIWKKYRGRLAGLVKISHQEKAWKETPQGNLISYKLP